MNFWKLLTIVSVSVWLGVLVFFSAFVAPAAFSVLDRESAGRLVSTVFPRYYGFGVVLGTLALAGVIGRLGSGRELPWGPLVLLLVMLALSVFSLVVLLPKLHALRPPIPGASTAFARIHRLSVALNLATMLAGLTLVFERAVRRRGVSCR